MDTVLLVGASAAVVTSAVFLAVAFRQHRRNTRALRIIQSQQISANSHIQKTRMDLMETRNRARLLEETVKNGTSAVEKVHKAITTTTFSLIDRFSSSDEFRENARQARETHDQTSDQIYRSVRTTNKALHVLADTLFFGRKEKQLTARKKPKHRQ